MVCRDDAGKVLSVTVYAEGEDAVKLENFLQLSEEALGTNSSDLIRNSIPSRRAARSADAGQAVMIARR